MTFVSVLFALVGLRIGTNYTDRDAVNSLVAEAAEPAGAESGDTGSEDSVSDSRTGPGPTAIPTTTTRERTGAAASSAVVTEPPPADNSAEKSAEQRGEWALDQIGYPWAERLPGWTVEFHDERDGLFGLTVVDDKRIEIYVRPGQPDDLLIHIVAHELGHAVDVTLNTGDDRRRWQAIRGIEDEPWWPDSAASDFRTGAGDFAESFAYWQSQSDNYRSKLGPAPTEAQLEVLAELAAG